MVNTRSKISKSCWRSHKMQTFQLSSQPWKKELTDLVTSTEATGFTRASLESQEQFRAFAHYTSENHKLLGDSKYSLEIKLPKIKLLHRGKRIWGGEIGREEAKKNCLHQEIPMQCQLQDFLHSSGKLSYVKGKKIFVCVLHLDYPNVCFNKCLFRVFCELICMLNF